MGSNFSKMKKQAKALQEQFSKMQEDLKKIEEIGSSGSGLVQITLDGEKNMKKVSISPDCVDPEDVEALQDLIQAAYKDATDKVDEKASASQGGMGLNLPF
jgi:DNA-binding YbaB/EbfC family protein